VGRRLLVVASLLFGVGAWAEEPQTRVERSPDGTVCVLTQREGKELSRSCLPPSDDHRRSAPPVHWVQEAEWPKEVASVARAGPIASGYGGFYPGGISMGARVGMRFRLEEEAGPPSPLGFAVLVEYEALPAGALPAYAVVGRVELLSALGEGPVLFPYLHGHLSAAVGMLAHASGPRPGLRLGLGGGYNLFAAPEGSGLRLPWLLLSGANSGGALVLLLLLSVPELEASYQVVEVDGRLDGSLRFTAGVSL
jgi:hypothetical protein